MAQRTFTSEILSGSTNGRPILVAATATAGTLIHTAPAGTDGMDHLSIWVANKHTDVVALTLELGGTGAGDLHPDAMEIQANSPPILILDGQPLRNGLALRAFASVTNKLTITGRVRRIAP